MKENFIGNKSFDFALEVIDIYKYLVNEKKEFVLSKQLLRSGTSIGANVREAYNAQSRRDFLHKMNLALKEADESEYWIQLLIKSGYLNENNIKKQVIKCEEICKILNSTVQTLKKTI